MRDFGELGGNDYDLRRDEAFDALQDALGKEISKLFNPKGVFLEIGIGSGETTKRVFEKHPNCRVIAVDISSEMVDGAKKKFASFVKNGQLEIVVCDALEFLKKQKTESFDGIFSGLTFHNFLQEYRKEAFKETFRVLKKGGYFLNLDLFAFDDPVERQRVRREATQEYVDAYTKKGRIDLANWWVKHIEEDNFPERIMLVKKTFALMKEIGFSGIKETFRDKTKAVVVAKK